MIRFVTLEWFTRIRTSEIEWTELLDGSGVHHCVDLRSLFRLVIATSIMALWARGLFAASAFVLTIVPLCRSLQEQRPTDYLGNSLVLEIVESASLLNGTPIKDADLPATIMRFCTTRNPRIVFVRMNDDLPYGRFMQVMGLLANAKLDRCVLLTDSGLADLENKTCLFVHWP